MAEILSNSLNINCIHIDIRIQLCKKQTIVFNP